MADYKSGMTSLSAVADSIRIDYEKNFILSAADEGVVSQFVSKKSGVEGSSVKFPKYAQLALQTSALTDKEDPASLAMSDSQITISPVEYGAVVTKTEIAELQSGGNVGRAAAKLVGSNMGRSMDKLAILAAEASSNELFGGSAANEGAIAAGDVMTVTLLQKLYNKLARQGVAPLSQGLYVAVMHDDVIHDLRNSSGSGSFQDIGKYQHSDQVFRNEVGMLAGFRIVRDSNISINADAGDTNVDTYHTLCLGFNALGQAVTKEPELRMNPAGDSLNRFSNVGWYGIFGYSIIDTDACWIGTTSSSLGAN